MKKCLPILLYFIALAAVFAGCNVVAPISISLYDAPNTYSFVKGTDINLAGASILVAYEDGSTAVKSINKCEIKGYHKDTLGRQTITIVYTEGRGSYSTTLDITVTRPSAISISLDYSTAKTTYFEGETINLSGLAVSALLQDQSTIAVTAYTVNPKVITAGTTAVTITYNNLSAAMPITVVPKLLTTMEISAAFTKTTFYVGDIYSSAGGEFLLTYNNGDTLTVPSQSLNITVTDNATGNAVTSITSTSMNEIRYTYNSDVFGTVSYVHNITVLDVVPISLSAVINEDFQFIFYEGNEFDFHESDRALTFKVLYNNGQELTLFGSPIEFTALPSPLTADTTSVTIHYLQYDTVTCTVPVTVIPLAVQSITIQRLPNITDYYAGHAVDLAGLILYITYNNGVGEFIHYSDYSNLVSSNVTTVSLDDTSITVTYAGKTAAFNITVEELVVNYVRAELTSQPTKLTYTVGEEVDFGELVLTLHFDNEQSLDVFPSDSGFSYRLLTGGAEVESSIIAADTTGIVVRADIVEPWTNKSVSAAYLLEITVNE